MASDAQIAANRRNAQRSTGPRTAEGKARSRLNALRHGLAVAVVHDIAIASQLESFAGSIAQSADQLETAQVAAEAHLEVLRVRQVKSALLIPPDPADTSNLAERVCRAFAQNAPILLACERYERRALSKRKRALAALPRPRKPQEHIGPRLPRPRKTGLFDEPVVWRLQVNRFVQTAEPCSWDPTQYAGEIENWVDGELVGIGAVVQIDGEASGVLKVELMYQTAHRFAQFPLVRVPSGVRDTWMAVCPKTGKRVKTLYVVGDKWGLHSRHVLELTYRSQNWNAVDRHDARVEWNMARIGAGDDQVPPPRPKYMRRETFNRCWWNIVSEATLSRCAGLGRPPPDFPCTEEEMIDGEARRWGLVVPSKSKSSR